MELFIILGIVFFIFHVYVLIKFFIACKRVDDIYYEIQTLSIKKSESKVSTPKSGPTEREYRHLTR